MERREEQEAGEGRGREEEGGALTRLFEVDAHDANELLRVLLDEGSELCGWK